MEKAISNLLGNLPQRYFAVSVSMRTEDLAELMWTLMRTGLMFRNAVYRMACWDKYLPSGEHRVGAAPHPASGLPCHSAPACDACLLDLHGRLLLHADCHVHRLGQASPLMWGCDRLGGCPCCTWIAACTELDFVQPAGQDSSFKVSVWPA